MDEDFPPLGLRPDAALSRADMLEKAKSNLQFALREARAILILGAL
jgi:hypothetical protein